jgi:3-oxoacyl-(acyl-carrier-protein) synthase
MAVDIMRTSVWITGMGAVSSAGEDIQGTLETFREGRRNAACTLPFASLISCPTFQAAAELPALAGRPHSSRSLRLAMHAARQALADAGLRPFNADLRVGVCLGTTVACQLNSISFYDAYRRHADPPMDPVLNYLNANLAQAVGSMLGAAGPRMTVANACSSGTDAIGVAANWIRSGLCDVAIAGGADELHQVPLAGFWSLGVMSTEPCAPFDRDRAGLNLGEGAGIVVLESAAHASGRGKAGGFEIAGYGSACDAHHLTAPHPEGRGLDAAIRSALAEAGITPSEISFINAHGTATLDNDRVEAKVIAHNFAAHAPFLSTKGYTGHTLGAAGGLEAVFTVLGLREGWVPASAGFHNKADDIPITPTQQRTVVAGEYALSTSLAFGGNNAALVIRRFS